jgi:hypothetical protein
MHAIELSEHERQLLLGALKRNATIKAAEKMLKYHGLLKNDRTGAERLRAKYDALLTLNGGLLARLESMTDD